MIDYYDYSFKEILCLWQGSPRTSLTSCLPKGSLAMFQPCHPASSFPVLSNSLPPQSSESTSSLDLAHSYLTCIAQLIYHILRGSSHDPWFKSSALFYMSRICCNRLTASVPPCLTTPSLLHPQPSPTTLQPLSLKRKSPFPYH